MTHPHDHHHHTHAPSNYGRAFLVGIILNTAFVLIEAIAAYKIDSLSLFADAGHNLSDVLSLVASWFAFYLSGQQRTDRFTYGLRGSTHLAALFNASFLLLTVGALTWEAIQRLLNQHSHVIEGQTVSIVAAIGIVINLTTAWMFRDKQAKDINIKSAYTHMIADAAFSCAVLIGGILIALTHLAWIDPVLTLLMNMWVAWAAWGILKEAIYMSLHSVPASVNISSLQAFFRDWPDVIEFHDLHVWALSTTQNALSVHLVFKSGHPGDATISKMSHELAHHHHIDHTTIQVDLERNQHDCHLDTK